MARQGKQWRRRAKKDGTEGVKRYKDGTVRHAVLLLVLQRHGATNDLARPVTTDCVGMPDLDEEHQPNLGGRPLARSVLVKYCVREKRRRFPMELRIVARGWLSETWLVLVDRSIRELDLSAAGTIFLRGPPKGFTKSMYCCGRGVKPPR